MLEGILYWFYKSVVQQSWLSLLKALLEFHKRNMDQDSRHISQGRPHPAEWVSKGFPNEKTEMCKPCYITFITIASSTKC